jgi:hypothetical protein
VSQGYVFPLLDSARLRTWGIDFAAKQLAAWTCRIRALPDAGSGYSENKHQDEACRDVRPSHTGPLRWNLAAYMPGRAAFGRATAREPKLPGRCGILRVIVASGG